jgi:hypothetical protein
MAASRNSSSVYGAGRAGFSRRWGSMVCCFRSFFLSSSAFCSCCRALTSSSSLDSKSFVLHHARYSGWKDISVRIEYRYILHLMKLCVVAAVCGNIGDKVLPDGGLVGIYNARAHANELTSIRCRFYDAYHLAYEISCPRNATRPPTGPSVSRVERSAGHRCRRAYHPPQQHRLGNIH